MQLLPCHCLMSSQCRALQCDTMGSQNPSLARPPAPTVLLQYWRHSTERGTGSWVLPELPAGIPPSPEGCWAEAVSVFGCCLAWLERTEQCQAVVTATFQDLQVCLNMSEVTGPKPTWLRWKFSQRTRKFSNLFCSSVEPFISAGKKSFFFFIFLPLLVLQRARTPEKMVKLGYKGVM